MLEVDRPTQLDRVRDRWLRSPLATFVMSETEVDRWRAQFEIPDAAELAGGAAPGPPPPWRTWRGWAEHRWPGLAGG